MSMLWSRFAQSFSTRARSLAGLGTLISANRRSVSATCSCSDARNIYRKVKRKIYDFSPQQLANITAVVWLYRGQQQQFLTLVIDYFARLNPSGGSKFRRGRCSNASRRSSPSHRIRLCRAARQPGGHLQQPDSTITSERKQRTGSINTFGNNRPAAGSAFGPCSDLAHSRYTSNTRLENKALCGSSGWPLAALTPSSLWPFSWPF